MSPNRASTRPFALCLLCAIVAAAACSSPPTEGRGDDARIASDTAERLAALEKDLEGLDPPERRDALIDRALQEGATVTAYGSTNLDEAGPIFEAFEDDTGVTVNYYRANSEDIVQRLVEEARAGFRGTDVVITNGPEMTILDREGLFARVESPAIEDITAEGRQGTWTWWYINTFAPSWNSDLIGSDEAPSSWEDVFTKYGSGLVMEAGDIDFFATLVKEYFVARRGMTEDAAIDLFRQAAAEGVFVDGHTLMTELLAAGEYSVAASPYLHRVLQLQKAGAPLDWEPAVEPLIARPNGVAIHSAAKAPAAALLLMEYLLQDAQRMLGEFDRQPASTEVEGGGLPRGYDTIVVDVEAVVEELDRWTQLYDEVVRRSSEEVIED